MEGMQMEIENSGAYYIQKSVYGQSLASNKAKFTMYYACEKSGEIMEKVLQSSYNYILYGFFLTK